MVALHSSPGPPRVFSVRGVGLAAETRSVGRVAGVVILLGALVALATVHLLGHRRVPTSFDLVVGVSMCSGVACVLIRWDRLPARWLYVVPAIATVDTALGIRLAGVFGDIAANYYVFVAVFAAYAFSSRRVVAAHVAFASAASALPLFYAGPHASLAGARTVVDVLLLVVIAGIVTRLREGLQTRQRELQELTVRDPLTGVGNYRLLSERLDHEVAHHRRSGESLTVMVLDLDGFKEINDTFGHPVGDRVLIEVARALASSVRAQDTLARQGGDEFSILAPDTDDEQAKRLATRAQEAVTTATNGSLSTSVGSATFPTDTQDPAALLALADADLRRAKPERRAPERAHEGSRRAGILRLVEYAAS
jgi:diguanylate cyclase (GGDEF)-like protein